MARSSRGVWVGMSIRVSQFNQGGCIDYAGYLSLLHVRDSAIRLIVETSFVDQLTQLHQEVLVS